ncbi:MAG: hypothetical protein HZA10_05880, partial [Nitrospirae bacterium]|nr:hypothetical protein [Nitrospirota bacterium]
AILAVVSTAYSALVDRLDKARLLSASSIFFCILFFVSRFLISYPPYLIFVFAAVEVQAILTIIQFWTIADSKYTVREGKRLFPLIMLFGLAAAGLSALSIKFIVSIIQAENIFILISFLMFINYLMLRKFRVERTPERGAENPLRQYLGQIKEGFSYIFGSSFLIAYAVMAMSIYLVNSVIEFEFAGAAASSMHTLNELTQYFGLVQGGATFLAFMTQMLFTARIIETLGIPAAVLIYPSVIFLAISGMTIKFGLAAATLSKMINDLFLYSIHDTVSSVLLNPVPERVRGKTRIFIQGIVRPAAAVVSSIFLIFAIRSFSTQMICMTALVFVFIWFLASFMLGRRYLNILVENLRQGEVDLGKYSFETLTKLRAKDAINAVTELLDNSDEKKRALAAHVLFNIGTKEALSQVAGLVCDPSPAIKILALKSIKMSVNQSYMKEVNALINHPDTRLEAIETFQAISPDAPGYFAGLLESEKNPYVKSSLIKMLVRAHGCGEEEAAIKDFLDGLISSEKEADRICAALLVWEFREFKLESYGGYLAGLLKSGNEEIVKNAILAIGGIKDNDNIPNIIPLLPDERFSTVVYETLINYGQNALPHISAYLSERPQPYSIALPLLSILGDIGDISAANILAAYLHDRDERIRLEAIKAFLKLAGAKNAPVLSAEKILCCLKEHIESALKLLYMDYYMASNYSPDVCKAYRLLMREKLKTHKKILLALIKLVDEKQGISALGESLESAAKKTKDCALEALETMLPSEIRKYFMLIFDNIPAEEKIKIISEGYDFEISSIEPVLMETAENGYVMERLFALHDLGEMKDDRFLHIFTANKDHDDPNVRETAQKNLAMLKRFDIV